MRRRMPGRFPVKGRCDKSPAGQLRGDDVLASLLRELIAVSGRHVDSPVQLRTSRQSRTAIEPFGAGECADLAGKVVSLIFSSWNRTVTWLRRLDAVRCAA
jgi:hypothetical protein